MYRLFLIIWVLDFSGLNLLEKINLNLLGLFTCIVVGFEVYGFWFFGKIFNAQIFNKIFWIMHDQIEWFCGFSGFLGLMVYAGFDYFVGNQFVDCIRIFWVWSWVVGYYNKMYFQWQKKSSLKVQFFVTKVL